MNSQVLSLTESEITILRIFKTPHFQRSTFRTSALCIFMQTTHFVKFAVCGNVFQPANRHGIMLHKMFLFSMKKTTAEDKHLRNFGTMSSLMIFLLLGVIFGPTIIKGKPHHIVTYHFQTQRFNFLFRQPLCVEQYNYPDS